MPSNVRHYHSSAAATRPAVSPEEEAEVCELPLYQVRELHERLEQSDPGPERRKALDDCVERLSIPIPEAAIILGVAPKALSVSVRGGLEGAFQHKGQWRIWTVVVRDLEREIQG